MALPGPASDYDTSRVVIARMFRVHVLKKAATFWYMLSAKFESAA
jgi:hypothetical protein